MRVGSVPRTRNGGLNSHVVVCLHSLNEASAMDYVLPMSLVLLFCAALLLASLLDYFCNRDRRDGAMQLSARLPPRVTYVSLRLARLLVSGSLEICVSQFSCTSMRNFMFVFGGWQLGLLDTRGRHIVLPTALQQPLHGCHLASMTPRIWKFCSVVESGLVHCSMVV